MTINICWLSKTNKGNAISIITDSRLSGGIRFDECKKIFSLPRGDCMISFSGTTNIAYTLINQAIIAVQTNNQSQSRYQDITELKGQILANISDMVSKIHLELPYDDGGIKDIEIILAGYSWKYKQFKAWRIRSLARNKPHHVIKNIKERSFFYSPDPLLSQFVADKNFFNRNKLIVTGTYEEAKIVRSNLFKCRRIKNLHDWGKEPIQILTDVLLRAHSSHNLETTTAGPLQYMRVFEHASTEMNAVLWPNAADYWQPTISGRFVSIHENFNLTLFDPRLCKTIQVPYHKNSIYNNHWFFDSTQSAPMLPSRIELVRAILENIEKMIHRLHN